MPELPDAGLSRVVTIDPEGAAKAEVAFSVPISDIQQMWRPTDFTPSQERKWWITFETAPQRDFPYLAFFNMSEKNRFSFGADSLRWDNRVESKINQEKGVYEIRLTVAAGEGGKLEPFKVTLDRRDVPWTDALGEWRDGLAFPKGPYPDAAWKPVYCSWYAAHAAIDQEWTERTAAVAAGLGFGTFILDDGWSYDEKKRVNPETIKTWYRDIGTWDAFSKAKFPDFRAHRERMRALGIKYIVWVAPYFVGTRSPLYTALGFDKGVDKPFEGNVIADPGDAKFMESVTAQFVKLLKESDLDGLKIDFLDYVLPSVEKPRGAVSLAAIEKMMAALRAVKPEGVFEFRQSYATPITAHLATQFRAGDVPFEWLANLQRIAQIRLSMGDGVPVHADPIYWSESETDENIDRHFLAAMAGVPMVSMDLAAMPQARRDRVARWLKFYQENVERFQKEGKWLIRYHNGGLAWLAARRGDETLLIVNDASVFKSALEETPAKSRILLNLSFEPLALPDGRFAPPASAMFF